jgi:putative membrane protein
MLKRVQHDEGLKTRAVPTAQRWMIALLWLAVILANINQPYAEVAPLHHVPTVALLLASPLLLRRWPLSNGAVACVLLFFLLHTLGGRYTYSNIPYDDWARALTGGTVSEAFGLTRNHYDRLVHFAFGLLSVPVLREIAVRHARTGPRLGLWMALLWVLSISALYEMFEWLLTLAVAGADADAYNGQQGDMWDPQKDMALAALGAIAMMGALILNGARRWRM